MVRKPDIQYVGQFYVHGSEARELAPKPQKKQTRTVLPKIPNVKAQTIYIDPVALGGILVSVVMLVVLVVGAFGLQDCWEEYETMSAYLSELKVENAELEHSYRTGYDLTDVESKALAIGMVPESELQVIKVDVVVPQPEPEPTIWDDIVWFLSGLFA